MMDFGGQFLKHSMEQLTLDHTVPYRGRKSIGGSVRIGCKSMWAREIKVFCDLEPGAPYARGRPDPDLETTSW